MYAQRRAHSQKFTAHKRTHVGLCICQESHRFCFWNYGRPVLWRTFPFQSNWIVVIIHFLKHWWDYVRVISKDFLLCTHTHTHTSGKAKGHTVSRKKSQITNKGTIMRLKADISTAIMKGRRNVGHIFKLFWKNNYELCVLDTVIF